MSNSRRCLIGGNWKCNGTVAEVNEMIRLLNGVDVPSTSEVVIGVPAIHLANCKANFKPDIAVSSEDVSVRSGFGAYTGEMTAQMLVDSGITWAIVGHSERRDGFGESNELVAKKVKQAIDGGMSVIACIGENLDERESGVTDEVNGTQLAAMAAVLAVADWTKVVIAYEPKWAIGTGK
ncbi:TPIP1, partial [Symbiodinium microadriaticum]